MLPGSVEQAREEHLEIINSIRSRNEKRAEQAARKHVSNSLALRLKLMRGEAMQSAQSDLSPGDSSHYSNRTTRAFA